MRSAPRRLCLALLLLAGLASGLALGPARRGARGGDPPPRPAKGKVAGGKKYALVVGVGGYKKKELRPLPYAERDAAALVAALERLGFTRVVRMTYRAAAEDADLLPTARNVLDQVRDVLEDLTPADTLVVAFTGHGVQFKGEKEFYLCPLGAELGDRETLLSLTALYRALAPARAGTKLLIVDAGYDSPRPGPGGPRLEAPSPQELPVPEGLAVLFGASAGQHARESARLRGGAFFQHLVEGLRGRAARRNGEMTLAGLVEYLRREVPAQARSEGGAAQLPVLVGAPARLVLLPGLPEGAGFTNAVGMRLVLVPAGRFVRGSPRDEPERDADEGPPQEVEIGRPFYMGAHEVTQQEYQKVMGSNPSWFSSSGGGRDAVKGLDTSRFPVEMVSHAMAVAFCAKLSELPEEKKAGRVYRLPTEAEWEYACRAGSSTPFHFGNTLSSRRANLDGRLPYGDVAPGPYLQRTAKAGSFKPNDFGLYDMHGNVAEWCSDVYGQDYYEKSPARDPQGPPAGATRCVRGGSWNDPGRACRSAYRGQEQASAVSNRIGFRVVCGHAAPAP